MSSAIREERGQATVEAAFALPVLMVLFLLLLQPGIVLYDRIVMAGAAAEGCRLLATSSSADASVCEDYIRRRLAAIPQIDQFHIHGGGCSYEIELSGNESDSEVAVAISTKLKPLPLLDAGMSLTGMTDASGAMTLSVEAKGKSQPDWVSESKDGTDPSGWAD